MARILLVVAHRDDETLGAGGVIRWHSSRGDDVFAVALTDGVSAREPLAIKSASQDRLDSSLRVADLLEFEWLDSGNFPDNALDSVPLLEVVKFVEASKRALMPHRVYTHFSHDLNIDHEIAARATFTAFRPEPGETCTELLSFEIQSSTDFGGVSGREAFRPNYFVDIESHLGRKLEALELYANEMRPEPHSRSISGLSNLARLRGNQVGLAYAEAFQVNRILVRK